MSPKSKPQSDTSSEIVSDLSDAVAEHLAPKAHLGHPLDPNLGKVLSADEEKSIDERGDLVVEGLPWSKAGTGLYVLIGVSPVKPKTSQPIIGGSTAPVPKAAVKVGNRWITVGVTLGKPTFHCTSWGACLELPSDLGRDRLKQQYVAEWLANTAVEALTGAGINMKNKQYVDAVGLWVANAANVSINQAGL